METRISELRLSFIWTERFPNLLVGKPPGAPMAFLGDKNKYMQEFNKVLAGTSAWSVPWIPSDDAYIHYFWYYYFGGTQAEKIQSDKAWDYLVPLRSTSSAKDILISIHDTEADPPEYESSVERINLENFYYPHGFALVITIFLKADLTFKEMVNKAIDVRKSGRFSVPEFMKPPEPPAGAKQKMLPLDSLAMKLLDRSHEMALGKGVNQGTRSPTPFSIVTFVKGSGVGVGTATAINGKIHKGLDGLSSWNQLWEETDLEQAQFEADSIPIRKSPKPPKSHLLYGSERGRTVWFPGNFSKQKTIHSLGCYHRNLTLLSMQTESLLGNAHVAAECLEAQGGLAGPMQSLAYHATDYLEQLYRGDKTKIYQSWSAREQIGGEDHLKAINSLRGFFNKSKLE